MLQLASHSEKHTFLSDDDVHGDDGDGSKQFVEFANYVLATKVGRSMLKIEYSVSEAYYHSVSNRTLISN